MSENTPEGERGEEKCAVWGGKERRKHCYSDLILCLWGRTVSVERWDILSEALTRGKCQYMVLGSSSSIEATRILRIPSLQC